MVFNALYSVAKLAGLPVPAWWQQVAHAVLTNLDAPLASSGRRSTSSSSRELAEDLRRALLLYKDGNAPPPADVLRLKRRLLCGPEAFAFFQSKQWEPWREDDRRAAEGWLP